MLAKVMNWVSRHILLAPFMCLFLLFACGSSHKAVKSDTEVIRKDSTRESVNIVHGSSTSLRELITTNGSYVIDFRVYDTRKPPDSLTGKPPLLADGHVEGDFNKNREKETAIKDSTKVKANKETTSDIHEEKRSETIKEKKEEIQAWISNENNRKTIRLLLRQLKKLILHLHPKKGKGEVVFGFDDPYTTGQVLTAVSAVYPFCHKQLDIYPVFDRQVYTAEGHFKGRIRAGTLLLIAGRMLLDKNFRGLLRKWLR